MYLWICRVFQVSPMNAYRRALGERARSIYRHKPCAFEILKAPPCSVLFGEVPVLTRRAYIKPNERLLLRYHRSRVVISLPDIARSSGPTMAKPSVEHIPAGGFVCRYKRNATQVDEGELSVR
jgi:hypothetical protein